LRDSRRGSGTTTGEAPAVRGRFAGRGSRRADRGAEEQPGQQPEHDEAYTTITKAQWAYPAILAAYAAVACSPEVTARAGSRLSCREVYLADPETLGEDQAVCDVAFPLADR